VLDWELDGGKNKKKGSVPHGALPPKQLTQYTMKRLLYVLYLGLPTSFKSRFWQTLQTRYCACVSAY
jgi:hypothetical protein